MPQKTIYPEMPKGGENRPFLAERLVFAGGIYFLFFCCYGIANRLIPVSACADLTTSFDAAIPLIPEFVYPFYLAYILILMPAALIRSRSLFIRSAVAFTALISLSCMLFFVLPVYVPRPSHVPSSFAGALVKRIYRLDRPVCGFPSLHVSTSLLAATIILREYRGLGFISLLFFLSTSASTLFIKQHVFFDVLGGIVMALAVDWMVLCGGASNMQRYFRAAFFILRTMDTRPGKEKNSRITESRKSAGNGIEYDLYESRIKTSKTFIIVHGITLQGERDHRLVNFSRSLAESGIRAAAIALPALKSCRFDAKDVEAIIELARELNTDSGSKVGLIGFSLGAGLALKAAADPRVSAIIDPVLLFGPYYSLSETWKALLIKGGSPPANRKELDDYIWLRLVLAYRAMNFLDLDKADKQELVELLESYCLKEQPERNRQFFERVLKKLDIDLLGRRIENIDNLETLSLQGKLSALESRVLIIHDKYDNLIPPEQSEKIMEELRRRGTRWRQKLLITPLLSHVTVGSLWRITDIFRIPAIMGEIFRQSN